MSGELGQRKDANRIECDPEGKCRQALIRYMERKFISRSREWGMKFGSSQGTCTGCSRALDICHAARGESKNTPKQWLDPLDLSGYQGVTPIKALIREHALNLVLADFDHNLDDVPDDSASSGDAMDTK
jgi:hypothetical protein